jgi:aminoglycoside phosphotransferase (APT) family kinase protein
MNEMQGIEYSQRLGRITDAQFEAATERLGAGKFVRAAPATSGLFGQNVFLTTSEGEFVFRGAPHWVDLSQSGPWMYEPHDLWQFSKEASFADLLHKHTDVPVPWPQLLDKESDIFGWPYIIMPKMPGTCFDDRQLPKAFSPNQRRSTARALGTMLVRLQRLEWPFAGDFDASLQLAPYPGGHTAHVIRETAKYIESTRINGAVEPDDETWIARLAERALAAASSRRANVYVHGDFKPGNLTLTAQEDDAAVTGVFDLHESRLGDGASDLCRQACGYLDFDPDMTVPFLESYRSQVASDPTIRERMPLYIVNDRVKFWNFFTRPPEPASWLKGKTFRSWAGPYVEGILGLL